MDLASSQPWFSALVRGTRNNPAPALVLGTQNKTPALVPGTRNNFLYCKLALLITVCKFKENLTPVHRFGNLRQS
jgi:hypothetical protein